VRSLAKLTLECWTYNRPTYLSALLISLYNQTFQDWDLTILEEFDQNYLLEPLFAGAIRLLRNQGHKILFLHPTTYYGCVKAAKRVMSETKTKYAMKLDDDHVFEKDVLEKLITAMEDDPEIGSIGGMLYTIGRKTIPVNWIPKDFNKWTGKTGKVWNDYSTFLFKFPEQIVRVHFLRAPLMYNAELLRKTDFIEKYDQLGYTRSAFRIESEISNTLEQNFGVKTCMHTGAIMWHYGAEGGVRSYNFLDDIKKDSEVYYSRWSDYHLQKVLLGD